MYQIQCRKCQRKYQEQTLSSRKQTINEKEGSVLFEHFKQYHNGEQCEIEISIIIKRCFGEPTTRLITEAVLINELTDNDTMNAKSEWNYVKLPRVAITRQ